MGNLKVRCSVSYHYYKRDSIDVFAVVVRDGIFLNTSTFIAPPTTQNAFQVVIDNYINKRAAYLLGGRGNKGPYLAAKTALMAELDGLSAYVDTVAIGDANIILISGFIPTKGVASQSNPPATPGVPKVVRTDTGVLVAEVDAVSGAEYYGCIVTVNTPKPENININAAGQIVGEEDNGAPVMASSGTMNVIFDFNKSRKKTFKELPLRVNYYFYFYAVNARGVSQFSTGTMMASS